MAGMKEIRGKIKSVQSTRKITKAMEMVAASKMRRAQERMRASRPYADKQEAVLERLLPLGTATSATDAASADSKASSIPAHNWDYVYEPDAQSVIDTVIKRYIEARVYQAVAENMASEQASRMVAMKSASDNAETVIDDLKLVYNKSRQAAITKELSEIVGGAAAV
ncbi:hypothetical protein BGZ92_002901 [Podila epicladia]|nr:hypothetical protein BGZ92_002901 [Podila epicladia]